MRRISFVAALVMAFVLATSAGCAKKPDSTATTPTVSTVLSPSAAPTAATTPTAVKTSAATAAWPTPEDCVSYNPATVTVHYEAGIHSVNDGSKVVMRLHGGPGDVVGQQGLALAKRFHKHCYIGRGNARENKNSYIFDYWRNPSGMTPDIPHQDDGCSGYDRNNLTVEDMGGGQGWRVKDHDHVLHLFDNGTDARNGKLVLSKYRQICFIGTSDGDDQDVVSYSR